MRPVIRYHGSKWRAAPWIISQFPHHRIYTEVFGGGASVLLRKPRSYAEIYNDLDGELINLFRVLRDPGKAEQLVRLVELTPFARAEFEESYEATDDVIEWARRCIVRSFMGHGGGSFGQWSTGFRAKMIHSNATAATVWANYPPHLIEVIQRLRGVTIENRDALEVLKIHDTIETLHYVDPPYPMSTRSRKDRDYRFEMTDEQHSALAEVVHGLKGMVVLSGYACDLYDQVLYPDWNRVTKHVRADTGTRTEVLWIKPGSNAAPALLEYA